ncbi:hypothetical protein QBC43DRAFT_292980 [Cladorrhinum sp. PSN259]|nr:hypothetical protein QBC43DRAFT_292980 [Cladorrhinum sp. PSN259]
MAADTSGSLADVSSNVPDPAITSFLYKFKYAHAQGAAPGFPPAANRTFRAAVREVRTGARRNQWHWHVLPTINRHLPGGPYNTENMVIFNLQQAQAYITDYTLGYNLGYILTVILEQTPNGVNAAALMGSEEAVDQLHSCVTLFDWVLSNTDVEHNRFVKGIPGEILEKYFGGRENTHRGTASAIDTWNQWSRQRR